MKTPQNVTSKSGLLKWLVNAVLVIGLVTFSGYFSESKISNSESTKTELNEIQRASAKRTVSFRVFDRLHCSYSYPLIQRDNFTFHLRNEKNRIALKLKGNFIEPPLNEQKGFLIYYSIQTSGEFHTNLLEG